MGIRGRDIAMCCIDHENKSLSYAGARNPLIKVSPSGELEMSRADRFSIGGKSDREGHHFTRHDIPLTGEDMYYIYSDGFQDQFGGAHDQKLCRKNFLHLLKTVSRLPCEEQAVFLENFLSDWVGKRNQIDDVLVIGFRG